MDTDYVINTRVRTVGERPRGAAPRAFHARLPGYARSRLIDARDLAEALGVGRLWIKDESARMGLSSFKILGASWATYRALELRAGRSFQGWGDLDSLGALVQSTTSVRRLVAATDGNHGQAVARTARWLGLGADIFVPVGTAPARIEAIRSEGASVTVVDGTYDGAVRRSAEEAEDDCLVISDTSWPGYVDVPGFVIDGYATIFAEAEEQLREAGAEPPGLVVVQIGVGALAAAAVRHHRRPGAAASRILGVEPVSAACVLASVRAERITSVPGPHPSIMAGLNCDTPSLVAWPDVSAGIDAFVAVDDDAARDAMKRLAEAGVASGATGAAGLAGLVEVCCGEFTEVRDALAVDGSTSVLLVSTEGATDPDAYRTVVGAASAGRK